MGNGLAAKREELAIQIFFSEIPYGAEPSRARYRSSAIAGRVKVGPASGYGCRVTVDKTPSRPGFLTIEQVADEGAAVR